MADLRGYVEGMINFNGGGGGGTTVIANPEGTPTDELNSIQVDDTIYSVGGGGESIVPTPTSTDRGKYLGVKSNADELEYRTVRELPNSEGASADTVLTHTISGDSWLPPAKELPPYSTVQNDKVLGVHNGALEWVEQSSGGGGIIYSTDEQEIGIWIDGSTKVYQKTYYLSSPITVAGDGTWTNTGIDISTVGRLVRAEFSQDVACWNCINGINDNGTLKATILARGSLTIDTITIRYTKAVS